MNSSAQQLGQQLLAAAGVVPSKEKLAAHGDDMQAWQLAAARQMRVSLPNIATRHRMRCVKFPKDTRDRYYKIRDNLADALQGFDALSLPSQRYGLGPNVRQQIEEMRLLFYDVELMCLSFEGLRLWWDTKIDINTHLYLDFYRLYSELTGRTGLGSEDGNGPLYRFTKEGVALVDPELRFPKSGAFRKLMTQNKPRLGV
jgi:hypothetical protein